MKGLLLTYTALVVLLALTWGLSMLPLGPSVGTVASILIAFVQATLVVRVFMQFGESGAVSKVWFFAGIGWLAILSAILMDYIARPWDARPRSWNSQPEARVIGSGQNAGAPTPLEGK